jgi:bacteriorhodopsin
MAWFSGRFPRNLLLLLKPKNMAEIRVEAKKHSGSSAWVWVLVTVLLIAAVAYFLTRNNKVETTTTQPASGQTSSVAEPSAFGTISYV